MIIKMLIILFLIILFNIIFVRYLFSYILIIILKKKLNNNKITLSEFKNIIKNQITNVQTFSFFGVKKYEKKINKIIQKYQKK